MKKYKVKWNYKSSLGGPYMKGDEIELDERLAEAINIDSPGVLVLAKAKKTDEEPEAAEEPAEKVDRMVTSAKTRSTSEEITEDEYKAVKDKNAK